MATYALPGAGIVFLDRSKRSWFLFYNTWSWMGVLDGGIRLSPASSLASPDTEDQCE